MKRIYAISDKASKKAPFTCSSLYLLIRTLLVGAVSLVIGLICGLIAKQIPGAHPLTVVLLVFGWATVAYGFFGGLIYLLRRP